MATIMHEEVVEAISTGLVEIGYLNLTQDYITEKTIVNEHLLYRLQYGTAIWEWCLEDHRSIRKVAFKMHESL